MSVRSQHLLEGLLRELRELLPAEQTEWLDWLWIAPLRREIADLDGEIADLKVLLDEAEQYLSRCTCGGH